MRATKGKRVGNLQDKGMAFRLNLGTVLGKL